MWILWGTSVLERGEDVEVAREHQGETLHQPGMRGIVQIIDGMGEGAGEMTGSVGLAGGGVAAGDDPLKRAGQRAGPVAAGVGILDAGA